MGMVISARLATLVELDTVLGVEDMHMLLEIATIDAHNRALAASKES